MERKPNERVCSGPCKFSNGWHTHQLLVLDTLKQLRDNVVTLTAAQQAMAKELVALTVRFNFKSGVWGLLAGAIPVVILLAWQLLKG